MKAILYNKKGSIEKLIMQEVDNPIPNEDQVLIQIHSVSPNAADYRSMKMGMIPKSKVFGSGISGTAEAVGKNIDQFKVGDPVIADLADTGFGGFAEFAVAPQHVIAHKPENIPFDAAAALPVAATTALAAFRKRKLQKDDQVLIIGSSGGVGTYAVQLAKNLGAEVAAVCSSRNVEQSLKLGADSVIDYTKEDITKRVNQYDLILAINGNYPLRKCKRMLKKNGTYVMVGGALSQVFKALILGKILSMGSKKILSLSAKANQKDLEAVAKLSSEAKLKPVIEKSFPLEETSSAMNYLGHGHASGKIIININT